MNERHFVSETDMEPGVTRLLLFVERSNVYVHVWQSWQAIKQSSCKPRKPAHLAALHNSLRNEFKFTTLAASLLKESKDTY